MGHFHNLNGSKNVVDDDLLAFPAEFPVKDPFHRRLEPEPDPGGGEVLDQPGLMPVLQKTCHHVGKLDDVLGILHQKDLKLSVVHADVFSV